MKEKSKITDKIILATADEARKKNKHLIKSKTILNRLAEKINLTDSDNVRCELLEAGAKDLINERFNALGYYSIRSKNQCGFFVNIDECKNISYLEVILETYMKMQEGWERQTEEKIKRRINEIRRAKFDGQMSFDENMEISNGITEEKFAASLEADAV